MTATARMEISAFIVSGQNVLSDRRFGKEEHDQQHEDCERKHSQPDKWLSHAATAHPKGFPSS